MTTLGINCPFCGERQCFIQRGWEDYGPQKPITWVQCRACDARGPTKPTEMDAIAAWNHRWEVACVSFSKPQS